MKRKITLLALAGSMAGLGARGLAKGVTPSAALACEFRKPSRLRRSTSPRPVKPAPTCQRNSRRVRPQNVLRGEAADGWVSWYRIGAFGVRIEPRRARRAQRRGSDCLVDSVLSVVDSACVTGGPPGPLQSTYTNSF